MGLAVSSPRAVLEKFHDFNRGRRDVQKLDRVRERLKEEKAEKERAEEEARLRNRRRGGGNGKGRGRGKGKGRGRGRGGGRRRRAEVGTEEEKNDKHLARRKIRRRMTDLKNFFVKVPWLDFQECLKKLLEEVQRVERGATFY